MQTSLSAILQAQSYCIVGICWQVLPLLGSLLVVSGSSDFWFLRVTNSCFTPQVLHVRACISYTQLLSYCPYELQNKTSADFTATIFHFKLTVAHSPCFCYSACHIFYSHFTVVSGSSLSMRSSKLNEKCHSIIFVLASFHDGPALMLGLIRWYNWYFSVYCISYG